MQKTKVAFISAACCVFSLQAVALFSERLGVVLSKPFVVNLSNFAQVVASGLAFVATLLASRRAPDDFARRFWKQLAYAFAVWSVAQLVWSIQESDFTATFRGMSITLPIFFFSFAPFVVLLTMRTNEEHGLDWLRVLDSLQIIILLLGTYIWLFYIPYQTETDEAFTQRTLDHVFMFRNVSLWLALALRLAIAGERNEGRLFRIALTFMTLYMIATQIPTFGRLRWDVQTGGWMDLFWTIPFAVVTVQAAYWVQVRRSDMASSGGRAWLSAHIAPSVLPVLVLAFSAYMAARYPVIAVTLVLTSFACYSVRLGITQYQQEAAKVELGEAELRFRSLFHQNSLPMWVTDRETGVFLEVNAAAIQRYGYSQPEFLTKKISEIAENPDISSLVELTMVRSSVQRSEERHRAKDGELISVAVSRVDIEFADRPAELWTIQDISEQKKLEHQLRQSQKMEAVGTLAGGIAHDFNNLLTIITGYSQVILERTGSDEQLRREVQQIEVAANKATSLIRQLLAFSRRQLLQPQILNLESLVANMEKMLRRLIGENIDLVVRTTGSVGNIQADPGQIEQILLNLAVNARDAMESRNGGRLTFELQNVELDTEFARDNVGALPGSYVMLAVSDTGSGMSPEVRSRIFEPFFTTKGSAGSGLGLATVYGIVQQSGGYIKVNSTEGRGTTFRVFFPRVEGGHVLPESAPEALAAQTGSETILLVEDDDGLRALTRRILLKHGYQVLEASRTSEAELMCKEHPGKIQLLLTDVVMPGMSGKELSSRLTSIRHEMIVLYMSGYMDSVVMKQGIAEGSVNFISKPFTPSALSMKVREVLDAHFGKRTGIERPYLRG